jgi:hypothetical protein
VIETELVGIVGQYGLLGVMFILLIYAVKYLAGRDETRDKEMRIVIENNTVALTRFVETTKKCEVMKK